MKKMFFIFVFSMFLFGCGVLDNSIRSMQSVKEKIAFALNTTEEKIEVLDRVGDIISVNVKAKYQNKIYRCYYTTAIISSYALCSSDGVEMPYLTKKPLMQL